MNATTATDALAYYARIGAALFPLPEGSKEAAADFRNASTDPAQWAAWQAQWPGCNFAVVAYRSRLIIVDVDDYDAARAAWATLCASWGVSASDFEPQVRSARGGLHIYFAIPGDIEPATLRQPDAMERINVRAIGYTVAAGSHFDGKPYTLLCEASPYPAPAALLEHFRRKPKPPAVSKPGSHDPQHVAAMLRKATEAGAFESYQSWLHAGFALKAEYEDDGFDLWAITFDETVDPDTAAGKWQSFKGNGVTIKSLIDQARKAGWQGHVGTTGQAMFGHAIAQLVNAPSIIPPCPVALDLDGKPYVVAERQAAAAASMLEDADAIPPEAETELADGMVAKHLSRVRYCDGLGWLAYNGTKWLRNRSKAAGLALAREHVVAFARTVNFEERKKIASAKTIANVEKLAACDPRIAATVDMFDADPWLLNTPEGWIDLRTGILSPLDSDMLFMNSTAVAPIEGEPVQWLKFLDRALQGNAELIAYVQRLAGYCLTGDTREEALFFLFGSGANGKSVFLNTLAGILADYARSAPMETFVDSKGDRHPTDLAGLMGARLVTVSETEQSQRWAESKIKRLTGRDPIPARFMRGDFFEYVPQFKLLFAGNHQPTLRGVDESIARRFNMLPFTVTIPAAERDRGLPDKLREEWPQILAWMLEGCRAWLAEGLQPPEIVQAFTGEYLQGQDGLGQWLEEAGERDPKGFEKHSVLFASWSAWCFEVGETSGIQKALITRLRSVHWLQEHKRDGARGFAGYRLKPRIAFPVPPLPERQGT